MIQSHGTVPCMCPPRVLHGGVLYLLVLFFGPWCLVVIAVLLRVAVAREGAPLLHKPKGLRAQVPAAPAHGVRR